MPMNSLQDLLKHDLGDILFAERQILKALKTMIRETSDAEMKARLQEHEGETEQQVSNVEQAFEAMGWKVKAQKCPGILGIIEEKKEFKEEEEPSKPILESFNLGAGLRVEHYEIAAYRSAVAVARAVGANEVVTLLKANLDQELAMAKFIEGAAAKVLRAAQSQAGDGMAKSAAKQPAKQGDGMAKSAAKQPAKQDDGMAKSAAKQPAKSSGASAAS